MLPWFPVNNCRGLTVKLVSSHMSSFNNFYYVVFHCSVQYCYVFVMSLSFYHNILFLSFLIEILLFVDKYVEITVFI